MGAADSSASWPDSVRTCSLFQEELLGGGVGQIKPPRQGLSALASGTCHLAPAAPAALSAAARRRRDGRPDELPAPLSATML